MIRLHNQRYWWFQNISGIGSTGLPAKGITPEDRRNWELISSSPAAGTLYTPIILFPDEDEESVVYFGNDILLPRVENYEGILFAEDKDFNYKGHTWNDVTNLKLSGDIYNIPDTKDNRGLSSWSKLGFPDAINPVTGNNSAAWYPIRYNRSKYLLHDESSYWKTSGVITHDIINTHEVPIFYYFDRRSNNIYYGYVPQWYTDREGRITDAYLNPIGSSGNYYYLHIEIFVYRVVGLDPGGRPILYTSRVSGYYDSDGVLRNDILIFRGQRSTQVKNHLESLCRISASYEGPLSPTTPRRAAVRYIPDASYWRLTGTTTDIGTFKDPSYDHLFPQKDRNHIRCNWNAIAAEAYQTLGMTDMNGIAGALDILNFNEDVKKMADTLRSVPKGAVKAIASAYLGTHYGFKLMVLDAKGLLDTMSKYAEQRSNLKRCQASTKWSVGGSYNLRTYTARYQVYYDEFAAVESILRQLLEIADFSLTTENWWDMVSMSFVVDWFIGIGDVLQSLDTFANLTQKHEVICCGRSIKGRRQLRVSNLFESSSWETLPFDVYASYYTRQYQKQLILPSLVPSVTLNPFNHTVEGAALIISRH